MRVFSCSELRFGFSVATVARWKLQSDVRVIPIVWSDGLYPDHHFDIRYKIGNNNPCFATESLKLAEQLAQSDPYIICNDDNLPYGQDFVKNGLDIMQRNKDYGCISGVVVNEQTKPIPQEEITEIHSVGGLVFLRKGLVTEFPALEDAFWDIERDRQVKSKGYRTGMSYKLPYLHMGSNFSVANPAFFTGA